MRLPTVYFFQRKPRSGANFSIEFIFDSLREKLSDNINWKIFISPYHNTGIFSKILNILEAKRNFDPNVICHITGETHFLNFFMNKKRVILTIHDCGMVHRKKGLVKYLITKLYIKLPISKSAIITTVSETTKQEILKIVVCDPKKIHVIPVAVNNIFQPSPQKFNHIKPTILQIGTGYNKNIPNLIRAISGITCKLVIIGILSSEQIDILESERIDYENYINLTNNELLEKYILSDIVSFISTFEGFGMPIIEGNCVERVVITSNISSMPEVAGNAALLVNPYDIGDIQNGFKEIINNETLRKNLVSNGRINKQRFLSSAVANMYLDVYNKIM